MLPPHSIAHLPLWALLYYLAKQFIFFSWKTFVHSIKAFCIWPQLAGLERAPLSRREWDQQDGSKTLLMLRLLFPVTRYTGCNVTHLTVWFGDFSLGAQLVGGWAVKRQDKDLRSTIFWTAKQKERKKRCFMGRGQIWNCSFLAFGSL